jgi:hypothetical protein
MQNHANITRLVYKLSQMRGAALKLGQFLSIQGSAIPIMVLAFLLKFWSQTRIFYLPRSTKYLDKCKTRPIICLIGSSKYVYYNHNGATLLTRALASPLLGARQQLHGQLCLI